MLEKILEFIKSKIVLIIVIIVILVLAIWIIGMIGNKSSKGSSYDKVSLTLENAARRYYEDKPEELPKNGKTVVIEEKKLVTLQYMKSINSILGKENVSCTGKVSVSNLNGNYRYTPNLKCGDDYSAVTFIDKVKEDGTVTTGNGLYDIDGSLVFRGEHVDNYVMINKNYYRILKISDNKVYLVTDSKILQAVWDDRYNSEKKSSVGINDYSVSRIKDTLDDLYNSNTLFTDTDKLMITTQDLIIEKAKGDSDISNVDKTTLENQYLGMITIDDYMNASLDNHCKIITDNSCVNYNYLANVKYSYWLLTTDADSTYRVYKYNSGSGLSLSSASSSSNVKIVVALTGDTLYVSGTGTLEDPYIIK